MTNANTRVRTAGPVQPLDFHEQERVLPNQNQEDESKTLNTLSQQKSGNKTLVEFTGAACDDSQLGSMPPDALLLLNHRHHQQNHRQTNGQSILTGYPNSIGKQSSSDTNKMNNDNHKHRHNQGKSQHATKMSMSSGRLHWCLIMVLLFILIFLSLPLLMIRLANTDTSDDDDLYSMSRGSGGGGGTTSQRQSPLSRVRHLTGPNKQLIVVPSTYSQELQLKIQHQQQLQLIILQLQQQQLSLNGSLSTVSESMGNISATTIATAATTTTVSPSTLHSEAAAASAAAAAAATTILSTPATQITVLTCAKYAQLANLTLADENGKFHIEFINVINCMLK